MENVFYNTFFKKSQLNQFKKKKWFKKPDYFFKKLLFEFIEKVRNMKNPYGVGNSSEQIVKILKEISLDNLVQKQFVD